jgi:hypothetical protein
MATSISNRKLKIFAGAVFAAFLVLTQFVLCAQATIPKISKPQPPEFTVEIVSHPYDVPSTNSTSIDEYTGKVTTTTNPGYHVENKSLQISIKNYNISGNPKLHVFYSIRTKGHYGEYWREFYPIQNKTGFCSESQECTFISGGYKQSDSDYTVEYFEYNSLPKEGEVDFQVKAVIGYDSARLWKEARLYIPEEDWLWNSEPAIALVAASDWSENQTLTVQATNTPTPTATGQTGILDSQSIMIAAAALTAILCLSIVTLTYTKRKNKTKHEAIKQ